MFYLGRADKSFNSLWVFVLARLDKCVGVDMFQLRYIWVSVEFNFSGILDKSQMCLLDKILDSYKGSEALHLYHISTLVFILQHRVVT